MGQDSTNIAKKVKRSLKKVYDKVDEILNKFVIGYFLMGIGISPFYDSWLIGFLAGGGALLLHFLVRKIAPGSFFQKHLTAILLYYFTVQFFLQMNHMFEVQFVFFISMTLLLLYEDWKIYVPVTLIAFGVEIYSYNNSGDLNAVSLTIHLLLILLFAIICMVWAGLRQKQTIRSAENFVKMNERLEQMTHNMQFAEEITKGNLKYDYRLKDDDELGKSLMNMKNNLVEAAEREKKEKYVNVGMASIGEILRSNVDNLDNLCNEIISKLISYSNANQGGIFILKDEGENSKGHLELVAARAFERKKYIEKRVEVGQGLVGQTVLEGEPIYLTEVPQDYINITSGLGGSNPKSILLNPLKSNDVLVGVIELASFKEFSEIERDFIEKVAESIASTIISAKNNQKTKDLLEQSEMLTEQMRAQEEEMRQNMEEMQATQEEMQRTQKEALEQRTNLDAFVNNSQDFIFSFDVKYTVTIANNNIKNYFQQMGTSIDIGDIILDQLPKHVNDKWKTRYAKILKGDSFKSIEELTLSQHTLHVEFSHFPIRNELGNIVGGAIVGKNITEQKLAQDQLKANSQVLTQKESNLNALINSTQDSILTMDRDYRVVIMNDVAKRRYRGTQFENIKEGQDTLEMLGNLRDEWKGYYDRALQGEEMNFTLKSLVKGEDSFREYFINPVKDQNNKIIGISVSSRDVTEKVVASNSLELKEATLNALINNNKGDTYFAMDKNYRIIVVNDEVKNRLKASNIILEEGKNILEALPKELVDKWKGLYDKALAGNTSVFVDERKEKNGQVSFLTVTYSPIKDSNGEIFGATVVSKNITREKELEKDKKKLLEEIKTLKGKRG